MSLISFSLRHYWWWICVCCLGIVFFALGIHFIARDRVEMHDEAYWKERIEKVGGMEAYQELSRILKKTDISYQHVQAHVFGGVLYDVRGLSAIAVCDLEFSMGCYHEYLGRAISDKGVDIVLQLAKECSLLPVFTQGGCFHGIGHGIQATLGYAPKDLGQAVEWCSKISVPYPFAGESCAAGLYMEYHFRTLSNPSTPLLRPVVEDNYFSPCDTLPQHRVRTCILYLPEWWITLLYKPEYRTDDAPLYKKMGEMCHALNLSRELEDTCFTALGVTSVMDTDTQKIIKRCRSASRTPKEETLCRGAAAWQFRHNTAAPASQLCTGLLGDALEYCMAYATGDMKILHSVAVPVSYETRTKP